MEYGYRSHGFRDSRVQTAFLASPHLPMAHLPSARSHSSRQPSPRQPSPESRPNRDWTYYSPDTGYSRPSDVLFTPPIKRKSRPHAASSSGDVPPNSSARHRSGEHLEPRNQNPGIDIALRDLRHEASKSVNVYEDLVCGFEEQTEALKDWAEESTLDMAWKNKVDKLRSENEASQFAGVIERIASRQESVKSAMERAKQFISSWDERHEIELQIRTAKKAVLYCDGMVDLAKRAAEDRRACGYLVQELKDVKNLLTRKRHPWICKFDFVPFLVSRLLTADHVVGRWRGM